MGQQEPHAIQQGEGQSFAAQVKKPHVSPQAGKQLSVASKGLFSCFRRTSGDGGHQVEEETAVYSHCAYSKLQQLTLGGLWTTCPSKFIILVWSALVRAHLEYCGQLWVPNSTGTEGIRRGTGRGLPNRSGTSSTGPVRRGCGELGLFCK